MSEVYLDAMFAIEAVCFYSCLVEGLTMISFPRLYRLSEKDLSRLDQSIQSRLTCLHKLFRFPVLRFSYS